MKNPDFENVAKSKYAEFLESMVEKCLTYQPVSVAVNLILEDRSICSGYFECCTNDKLTVAASVFRDAVQESIEEKEEQE